MRSLDHWVSCIQQIVIFRENDKQVLEWVKALVLVINVAQLITISVRYAIDNEEFANEWIDYNCSNLGKYITFDTIFIVWTGCIVTGITHIILFKIGEKRDSVCLMLSSVVIGIIKELVSN